MGSRLVCQCAVNQIDDVLLGGSRTQGRSEVLLDEGTGQLGEQLQVLLVRSFRSSDEEDDVRGAILGTEVHLVREAGHRKGRLGYCD
ncbi:hypothetical protein AHiyo8_31900 [Arthrobacter sp. Hiyo8]|nr:hypothetical protein AHiyo8_31900 [Arthrobacter sp. Hiyo8]